jgi:hypothetical protein
MTQRILCAALLLFAAFAPFEGRAALTFSDVTLTASTEVTTQLLPKATDFDSTIAPPGFGAVRALSVAQAGVPFPNLRNRWAPRSLRRLSLATFSASASTASFLTRGPAPSTTWLSVGPTPPHAYRTPCIEPGVDVC